MNDIYYRPGVWWLRSRGERELTSDEIKERKQHVRSVCADEYMEVLIRLISTTANEHATLRALVYEIARVKLRTIVAEQLKHMGSDDARNHFEALEDAIERVEAASVRAELMVVPFIERRIEEVRVAEPVSVSPKAQIRPSRATIDQVGTYDTEAIRAETRTLLQPQNEFSKLSYVVRSALVTIGIIGGAYGLLNSNRHAPSTDRVASSTELRPVPQEATQGEHVSKSALGHTPGSFGVFAFVEGQLYKLETLPIRMPDQRIQVGPVITIQSKTRIPQGAVEFVIYRRDLANQSPDGASVRVIASILSSTSFENGKVVRSVVSGEWAIRNQTFDFAVHPVAEDKNMVRIKPVTSGLILPAGRYVLVLKDQAYDFEVDGPISQSTHCLERFQATGGVVYSPCASK